MTNIISDGYVPATVTDSSFIDPWGISGTSDFWIDTAVTGFSYVADANSTILFKTAIPPAGGSGTGQPTGTVLNTTNGFVLSNGAKASFLFGSLDGQISGWNGKLLSTPGDISLAAINNSAAHAVYTDIALDTNSTSTYLLAANFGAGATVEVYDQNFKSTTLAGSFTDPNVPAGYAPYAIHPINGKIYITYMLRSTTTYSETLGTNTGFVSVFDVNGNFLQRAITGGNLNAPWGMALAPSTFGIYGGDLLVGNLGDGLINVYDPNTFAYIGQLIDASGNPILASLPGGSGPAPGAGSGFGYGSNTSSYTGLWEIVFGHGVANGTPTTANAGDPNTLYFAAGLDSETHGLFGAITPAATATGTATFGLSTSTQIVPTSHGQSGSVTLSVEPVNGFSGTVTFACSGLPVSASCSFSPATVNVTGTAASTTQLTITANNNTSLLRQGDLFGSKMTGITAAMLLPFGALLLGRRKRKPATPMQVLGVFALLLIGAGVVTGCGGSSASTPAGTSQVTVTATSGTVSHSSTFSLIVP